jgi:hypothetical protein
MLPLILLGAGVWAWHRHKTKSKPVVLLPPAAAQLHGDLMGRECNPTKLEKAADHFANHGGHSAAQDLRHKASTIREQAKVVPDLVQRARAADQNAMGMIAAIREEAAKGNPRAVVSAGLIAKYCQKFPAPPLGPFGEVPM